MHVRVSENVREKGMRIRVRAIKRCGEKEKRRKGEGEELGYIRAATCQAEEMNVMEESMSHRARWEEEIQGGKQKHACAGHQGPRVDLPGKDCSVQDT